MVGTGIFDRACDCVRITHCCLSVLLFKPWGAFSAFTTDHQMVSMLFSKIDPPGPNLRFASFQVEVEVFGLNVGSVATIISMTDSCAAHGLMQSLSQ